MGGRNTHQDCAHAEIYHFVPIIRLYDQALIVVIQVKFLNGLAIVDDHGKTPVYTKQGFNGHIVGMAPSFGLFRDIADIVEPHDIEGQYLVNGGKPTPLVRK